ncbi:MAG: ferric reductase-like transmembrane domain-containing protein [Pirellulales bacterium]
MAKRLIPLDEAALVAAWLGLAAWCVRVYVTPVYYLDRIVLACQISGYAAVGFLVLSLLVSPLSRGAQWLGWNVSREASARLSRNAGIASALAALGHLVVVLATYLREDWWAALLLQYMQSGVLAWALLMLLLVGSVKPLMGVLRWQLWKPLFRLSFIAALLALHHVLYAPFASRYWAFVIAGAAVGLSLLRLVPLRRVPPVSCPPMAPSNRQGTGGQAASGN